MAIHFTDKQNKVLAARGHNVLVSAAAGSGKTAVLVERIIRMITEPVTGADGKEHWLDIDRLLVVTFTRAAAAQMRERIGAAISARLESDPQNRHLQRQETLLHHAQITTIDSFCTFLLRNHFSDIGLDPSFRQMDETENSLLLQDTLETFLEEEYAGADPAFADCVAYFCTGSSDADLEKLVQKLYQAADAHVDPKAWLEECRHAYAIEDTENWFRTPPLVQALARGLEQLESVARLYDRMLALCREPDGPAPYEDFLAAERTAILAPYGILNPEKKLREDLEAARQGLAPADAGDTAVRRWNRCVTAAHTSFDRLPAIRGRKAEGIDPEKKAGVQAFRDEAKGLLAGLRDDVFAQDAETAAGAMRGAAAALNELIQVTERFTERFAAARRQRNGINFSDLERLSLQVLLPEDEEGKRRPGKAAEGLRAYYEEILIDEYQDSNEVQELLLSTIAGEDWSPAPRPRFMVGDVKQSIYRFRNARPSIFVHKYETYRPDDPVRERIDLDQNFRSRKEVLDCVNAVFGKVMRREIGGVEYDDVVSLKPGAAFPAAQVPGQYAAELLAVTTEADNGTDAAGTGSEPVGDTAAGGQSGSGGADAGKNQDTAGAEADADLDGEIEQLSTRQKEALAIAQKIRALREEAFPVRDEETSALRPVRYRDIVILVRSGASSNEAFRTIFEREGIPLYVDSRTGYFAAEEVRQVLQFLRVLDNPLQDIPLYGVLRGYWGGFREEEIARIRAAAPLYREDGRSVLLYEALCACAGVPVDPAAADTETAGDSGSAGAGASGKGQAADREVDPALRDKCCAFLEQLAGWREKTTTTSIAALLSEILYDTGYMDHVLALPSGEQRQANVRELLVKAQDFEKTEYTGLFRFLRYIDQMHQFQVDYGEASVLDENADVVRLMTIHKSKGLEFPVCFVAGLGSRLAFRGKDTSGLLVTDPDLGCGIDYLDTDLRVRIPTLWRRLTAARIREESLGEELRVLYVAMTRAKEKLFLVGSVKNLQTRQQALAAMVSVSGAPERGHLPAAAIRRAGSFLDLILMSLEPGTPLTVENVPVTDLQLAEVLGQVSLGERLTRLSDVTEGRYQAGDGRLEEELERKFSYVYPHADLAGLFTKTTVSELKRAAIEDDNGPESTGEGAALLFPHKDPTLPAWLSAEGTGQGGQQPLTGAARGTAVHRCCELVDYIRWPEPSRVDRKAFDDWVNSLVAAGTIPAAYVPVLNAGTFLPFLHSDLAARMAAAAGRGELWREQPFVLGVPASRIRQTFPQDETVLIQGIIDAFFLENNRIVVVDYKTDHVRQPEELRERYQVQLDAYADALERILHRSVSGKYIYSFALQRTIRV